MNFRTSVYTRRVNLLIIICLMISGTTVGQGPGGDDLGNEPDTPVDGGVSLLLTAGAVYGVTQLRKIRVRQH
jgi:hypothetical protein